MPKRKEQRRPTFEEFVAQAREAFGFLSGFGFADAPLPQKEFVNQFQVRFTNGKLILVIEGINWGYNADVHLEDTAGVSVPLILFVPREHREAQAQRRPDEPDQCVQIRTAAQRVREHCVDLLQGDMTRFYDRAAEWKRMTGRDRSYQKRILP